MLTLKRKVTYIVISAIVLLIAIYTAAYFIGRYYVNNGVIKSKIISEVENKLNRRITMSDKIDFHIGLDMLPYIQLHDVTVSNFSGGTKSEMLSTDTLEIQIDLTDLLQRHLHILALKLKKPNITLETKNNINNWDFESTKNSDSQPAPDSATEQPSKYEMSINDIYISNGVVTYINNGKMSETVYIKNLHIESNDGRGEFGIELSGTWNKLDLVVNAEANILNKDHITFKLDKLKSGNSQLKGNLEIHKNPLSLKGKFISPRFSTNDFASTNKSNNGEYSIPDVQIPASSLNGSNIDFNLEIKELVIGKLPFSNVNLQISTNNNAVLLGLKPPVNLAGGAVSANVNYNSKPNVPVFNLKLTAKPLKLEQIFTYIMGSSPIKNSMLDLSVNLNSTGRSLRDIINNLSGKILATATAGQYVNSSASITNAFANVLSAMITFKKTDSSTAFSCAVVNFNVRNGIANANNGIGLESSYANVLGSGSLDLRNGRINFKITPQPVGNSTIDLTSFSVAQVINVNGTISNPQINLNPLDILNAKTAQTAITIGLLGQFAIPAELASMALSKATNTNTSAHTCQIAMNQ